MCSCTLVNVVFVVHYKSSGWELTDLIFSVFFFFAASSGEGSGLRMKSFYAFLIPSVLMIVMRNFSDSRVTPILV